jgi:hypothetical protein
MSAPVPIERKVFSRAEVALQRCASSGASGSHFQRRLEILEAAASVIGGFKLANYRKECLQVDQCFTSDEAVSHAEDVLREIRRTGVHSALALSALAREPLSKHEIRSTGAYYTDFRLASLIGRMAKDLNKGGAAVVDPASGSGMLLAAAAIFNCNGDRPSANWLAEKIIAADQSLHALRGARLSLASLTNDVGAIARMAERWLHGDSLLRSQSDWRSAIGDDLGVIVANPPWEKLKVLRHEHELAAGVERHYGAEHEEEANDGLLEERFRVRKYADSINARYPLAGRGETDLFVAFTQLMVEMASEKGGIAALLPAGLIRSKTTTALRQLLLDRFSEVSFTVIDNKPCFFEIDTRFKFVAVKARSSDELARPTLKIGYCKSDAKGCELGSEATIERSMLREIRPDLSLPEVRSVEEWELFQRMTLAGHSWSNEESPWWPKIVREVDMTRERKHFIAHPAPKAVPVIEGRMVHQHRFGAKVYLNGSGRRASWATVPIGSHSLGPQFWINSQHLPASATDRVTIARAGFCDIAGQTNERSMMAAVIPPGVACGNKVPTVTFPNQPDELALDLWCGMVNSFAFDWMLRRVLTTTVNYFLLKSVPLPPLLPSSIPGRSVALNARKIADLSSNGGSAVALAIAELRREIDLACFRAYEIDAEHVALILDDFPSLDRAEPPLPRERRSTLTRDFVLSAIDIRNQDKYAERARMAIEIGARPYRPSQSTDSQLKAFQALRSAT